MKVHLRQRQQTKQGNISLYLEIYKGTARATDGSVKGLRDYEYLDLCLIDKPRSPIDKQHNKDTLKLAESIKANFNKTTDNETPCGRKHLFAF